MRSSLLRSILVVAVLSTAPSCAAPKLSAVPSTASDSLRTYVSDHLYFGRNIPGGGTVSESDWERFLSGFITPRFPAGLTVLRGQGQWRNNSGVVEKEDGFILQLLHQGDALSEKSVREIMTEYKTRFRQESVLRVRDSVRAVFW
jgi:hypothetical protein